MILLDTNVVSEIVKSEPDPAVASFVQGCPPTDLFLPSLVVAELRFGMQRLPPGRKRRDLEDTFEMFMRQGFAGRILDFCASCAAGYATARTARMAAGRPLGVLDALIGGMALAHGAQRATRNTTDFDGYGLTLVNPWTAA